MGIGSILGTALRGVAWGQVANVAMQYGPEIIKRIKERRQPQMGQPESGEHPIIEELQGRIVELESALVSQQELVVQQTRALSALEETARTLQARLNVATFAAAVFGVATIVLLVLLVNK